MWKNKIKKQKSRFVIFLVWRQKRISNILDSKQNWVSKIGRKQIVIIGILLSVVVLSGGYTLRTYFSPTPSETKAEKQYAVLPPVSMRIPSLKVQTSIESVAKDTQGRMDVPKDVFNTAWYNLGPKPGEVGNAVIAGHLDTPSGKPAIFYKLDTMKKGDEIEIKDASGITYVYRVVDKKNYPVEKFPITEVFGPSNIARLNLITCDGAFDQKANTYSKRTVVFSKLVRVQN